MTEINQNKANTEPQTTAAPSTPNSASDIDNVKAVSAVAYLGILFFVPMLMHPKNEFAMFHANQGLLLLITGVAVSVLGGAVPVLGWFIIAPLGSIFVLVLFIMGLVNAIGGHMKRLPLIGKFDLIKPTP